MSYTAYVGQTVTNIDEVQTWIDANIPATKALSNEELKLSLIHIYIEQYVGGKKGYKKNKYKYDERTVQLVQENWNFALEQWKYDL